VHSVVLRAASGGGHPEREHKFINKAYVQKTGGQ